MIELQEQIEEARRVVAIRRGKAERPGASLEDEFVLEKARNRLLTLELKLLKQGRRQQSKPCNGQCGTMKAKATPRTAKELAEATFAGLQKAGA